ncbi:MULTISPECIES: chorismate mutase [Paenibacillus]|jgi:chorismate mutase|uniref:chorismate mutase n=1 Tax=Paenibacillus typhae TaxID=1174501 RepID=A0A1G9FZV2_9BACL|nr:MULTISPECIES: chorismate mutase [Paenibacillus]MBY0010202.1 chorismate mutase [Paenibacillus typhae]MDF9840316.1 chorismate mutase [Paenibacillus sp. PastF-2]MDF9846898.1 chorismate mutase [Paenibacillus sp. PastM-2]MDF9853470.1 chorismate mutase [Paenibacillus sp. PastF-1]MDH6479043.1 chorismate mutase [Paenibacillus sp. PastH-2]
MVNRGIRGATTVVNNEENEILRETVVLLREIVERNDVIAEDICSVWITVTGDLDATFPARAIREIEGWELVPLMCSVEIPVKGGLPKCIRLMVQVNTDKSQRDIRHVYLNEAKKLRPDLSQSK